MTNLLIPANLTSELRIPDLTVSTGEPGGVWCARQWGLLRWSRRHVVRLPYDHVAAAKLRKRAVLDRVYQILPVYLVAILWLWFRLPAGMPGLLARNVVPLAASAVLLALSVLDAHWNVTPKPSRTGRGDLYLPDLPPAVAQRWLETNPGIRAVDRKPTYRRWPPWTYAAASLLCMAGAVGTAWHMFSGAGFLSNVPFVLLALIVGALTFAYLALPTGHTRLSNDN